MKILTLTLFCFFTFSAYGQNEKVIDTLKASKEHLEKRISILRDSLKMVNDQIEKFESKARIEKYQKTSIVAKFRQGASIKGESSAIAKPVYIFNKAKEVTVLDYYEGYFAVAYDTIYGFINEVWAEKSKELDQFVLAKMENEKLQLQLANQRLDSTNQVEAKERRNRLITEYGLDTYMRIRNHEYWLGMTYDMAIESLGYPKVKNRTVGKWGINEQWVYSATGRLILYFENGKLTSFQD